MARDVRAAAAASLSVRQGSAGVTPSGVPATLPLEWLTDSIVPACVMPMATLLLCPDDSKRVESHLDSGAIVVAKIGARP